MRTLQNRIKQIAKRRPNPKLEYYAITLLADAEGNLTWSCLSNWAGWAKDGDKRIELREASIVIAKNMFNTWIEIGQSCIVVDNLADLDIFFLRGGNALIEKTVAESSLSEVIEPQPVVRIGNSGFQHLTSVPKSVLSRAPTPAKRMQILKRDDFRCRVCGRRSADYVDVELHVHHIKPWVDGGVTHETNLITLCHTCHNGLKPHSDFELLNLIPDTQKVDLSQFNKDYIDGVRRYRERVVQDWSSSVKPKRKKA